MGQTSGQTASGQAVEARTRRALERYVRAWAENDRDAFLDVFAEDAEWIDPVGTPPYRGREQIARFWDDAHASGATFEPTVHRIVACGDEGLLVFRMIVRDPGGGGMALEACDVMQVGEDGRIRSGKAYWDHGCVTRL